jgi:hypothetical protein
MGESIAHPERRVDGGGAFFRRKQARARFKHRAQGAHRLFGAMGPGTPRSGLAVRGHQARWWPSPPGWCRREVSRGCPRTG